MESSACARERGPRARRIASWTAASIAPAARRKSDAPLQSRKSRRSASWRRAVEDGGGGFTFEGPRDERCSQVSRASTMRDVCRSGGQGMSEIR